MHEITAGCQQMKNLRTFGVFIALELLIHIFKFDHPLLR